MNDVHAMLKQLARYLKAEDLAKVAQRVQEVKLSTGQQLIGEGRFNDSLYVLGTGRLSVELERGARITLAECEPGACVGEMTWVDPGPANATVRALDPSVVFQLSHGALVDLRKNEPGTLSRLLQAVVEDLAAHLRMSTTRLSNEPPSPAQAAATAPERPSRASRLGNLIDAMAALTGAKS